MISLVLRGISTRYETTYRNVGRCAFMLGYFGKFMAVLLTDLGSSLVDRGLTLLQIDRNVVIHFEPTEYISCRAN